MVIPLDYPETSQPPAIMQAIRQEIQFVTRFNIGAIGTPPVHSLMDCP